MLLAQKYRKMLGFSVSTLYFYRCCVTSWNGRCCEFPLDVETPKPSGGFFDGWFKSVTEAPKLRLTEDRRGHHNAVEIKKQLRVPYYRILGNRVINKQNPHGNQWWALFG